MLSERGSAFSGSRLTFEVIWVPDTQNYLIPNRWTNYRWTTCFAIEYDSASRPARWDPKTVHRTRDLMYHFSDISNSITSSPCRLSSGYRFLLSFFAIAESLPYACYHWRLERVGKAAWIVTIRSGIQNHVFVQGSCILFGKWLSLAHSTNYICFLVLNSSFLSPHSALMQ